MLYMTTSDERYAFDFTYATASVSRSSQPAIRENGGNFDTFSADALLFALRESGLLRGREAVN